MTFRDDGEALRGRVEALERELEQERKQRLAAEAQMPAITAMLITLRLP